ncbi:MAG: methylaspartate mutase accessory protein GlmL [Oscillospiraceae bacterium]
MKAVLLIDFGSTYTKVTAVDLERESVLGTSSAFTTVETDVNDGLQQAVSQLKATTGPLDLTARYACSSAAGGLRMIAIGLVPELTAKAARLAALGAGAKVIKTYSFQLTEGDLVEIDDAQPDIVLLTGGIDGGNRDNILYNAEMLSRTKGNFPIVVAGNRSCADECGRLLQHKRCTLCENVMPHLGQPNIEPVQAQIREIFLHQIVRAKGLSATKELIDGILMPTPSAMMAAMKLLARGTPAERGIGDLIGLDLGGATTDIYSMTDGLPTGATTILKGLREPYAKRTVEGDIGMRYSIRGIVEAGGIDRICALSEIGEERALTLINRLATHPEVVPGRDEELERLDFALASLAVETAVARHAGTLEPIYTPTGPAAMQQGKDLTAVERIIVTGGALIHTRRTAEIAAHALFSESEPLSLRPQRARVLIDRSYILAAMGLLGVNAPDAALRMMKKELTEDGHYK